MGDRGTSTPKAATVLVVDDSAFYRQSLAMMLKDIPGIEVIGAATDGLEAIQLVTKHRPSLITLDLEMPRMDGFGFLRWLMRSMPTPVLVVSAASGASGAFQALDLGAADFIAKPTHRASWEILTIRQELESKLRAILGASPVRLSERAAKAAALRMIDPAPPRAAPPVDCLKLVAIGASTGGPAAIQSIMATLPGDLPCMVAIAQHMPPGFTASFAERLNRLSRWRISEAVTGQVCRVGEVLICPGGRHLSFERDGNRVRVVLEDAAQDDRYVPSIDRLMASAAETFGGDTVAVILTGMGHDGRHGMGLVKKRGGFTIAESEETAVVFGMPSEAIQEGAVNVVAPLHGIVDQIVRRLTVEARR